MNKFLNNPKGTVAVIVFIILIAVLFWAERSKAEEATRFEFGPTTLSNEFSNGIAVMISETWDDRLLLGFGLVGEQTGKFKEGPVQISGNLMVQGMFLVQGPEKWEWSKPLELGLGVAWFQETNRALGRHMNFGIRLGYKKPDKWARWLPDMYSVLHYSNAGTGTPNSGQDFRLMFGYTFD